MGWILNNPYIFCSAYCRIQIKSGNCTVIWGREESTGPPDGKTSKCPIVSGCLLFREEKKTVDVYEKCRYLRIKTSKNLALMRKNQPDQEIVLGHYFTAELDGDSQTGWKG